jgi:CheY-like chemotaxis protein
MLAQVNPVLDPLLVTPLRNAVVNSAWGRGKIDIPPGIARKLNDTAVVTSVEPVAPRFKPDFAKTMRVNPASDRAKGQKFKVRDERGVEGWARAQDMRRTKLADGSPFVFNLGDRAGFTSHDWEIGLGGGRYGGANLISTYGAYSLTDNMKIELTLSQFLGNASNGYKAELGLNHVILPEWRLSPFLELGTGTGHGTAWLLTGMDAASTLVTVDPDELVVAVARRHLGSDSRVTFQVADGAEFLREMRADPRLASLPVVLFSADGGAHAKAMSLGANDALRKPVQLRDLLSMVSKHCGHDEATD